MPIISSVPALNAITKGSPATFTLDKAELLLVPSVAASPYYSDDANWQSVVLNYVSSTGNQIEAVLFDATQASPTGIFEIATKGLSVFNIESITIVDFQQGTFRIPRSELNVIDFDVDMTPSGLIFDTFYNNIASTGLGEVHRTGGTDDWVNTAYRSAPVSGDFVFSGNVTLIGGLTPYSEQLMIGYQKISMPLLATANPASNVASALFAHSSTGVVETYNGTGGTASNPSTATYTSGTYPFSISRVGSSITGVFNGITKLLDTYSGDLYLAVSLFNNNGQGIPDSTLVE